MGDLVPGQRYAAFASLSLGRWEQLRGCTLSHTERGYGRIEAIDLRKGNPLVTILFDESDESVKFNNASFNAGRIEVELPASVLEEYSAWLAAVEEEEQIEREKESERQRQLLQLEENRKAQEAERKRRADIATSICAKYRSLIDKYEAPEEQIVEGDEESLLCGILKKFQSKQALKDDELAWLEQRELFRLVAVYFFLRYKRSSDLWDLVKTCKYLRRARLPERSLEVSDEVSEGFPPSSSIRAWSALQTSRGGALRDLGRFTDAISAAHSAISRIPSSYHPHMLLGAVHYDLSQYEQGDEHFNEAEKLGASSRMRDTEIRNKLEKAQGPDREQLVTHLLAVDPERYSWVERFSPRRAE